MSHGVVGMCYAGIILVLHTQGTFILNMDPLAWKLSSLVRSHVAVK